MTKNTEDILVYGNGYAWVWVEIQLEPNLRQRYSDVLYTVTVRARSDDKESEFWRGTISPVAIRRGFLWLKKISPEQLLREMVAKARELADHHALSYPDSIRRARETLLDTKRELAALQELELGLLENRK